MVKSQPDKGVTSGAPGPVSDDEQDRRQHLRVTLPLKTRFLTSDGCEWSGTVTNISAGGAMIRAKYPPAFGQSVVLYIDQIGRIEGKVVRAEKDTFAVSYKRKKRVKRAKIADQITSAMHQPRRGADRRANPRVKFDAPATVYLEDGRVIECAILDISLTGASIEISPRPPLGMRLILGRMTAKVIRRHEKGIGVVFTGAADKMDEVMADATDEPQTIEASGPNIAQPFGKKGARG